MSIPSGSTDRSIYFVAVDETDLKTREPGLSSFTVRLSRDGGASLLMTTPTITEIDNMVGVYALLLDEGTTIDAGHDNEEVVINITHAGMAPVTRAVELYRPKMAEGFVQSVTALGRVDVGLWSGTGVSLSVESGLPEVDMFALSGDSVAASNLERMLDGTGYTDEAAPATQGQLGALSTSGTVLNTLASSFTNTVGTVLSGDVNTTHVRDDSTHQIQDNPPGSGGSIDVYYEFDISILGNAVPVSASVVGRINSANDDLDGVYAWNWTTSGWERLGDYEGTNAATNSVREYILFLKYVGTGVDVGKVRIRFFRASGLTSPTLHIDQIFVSFTTVNLTSGFEGGQVWIDTVGGEPGTSPGIGFIGRPVDNLTDAVTIATNNNLGAFHVAQGSLITLLAATDEYEFNGFGYTVDLNGQSISGTKFFGAGIIGNDSGSNVLRTFFDRCVMTTNNLGFHRLDDCSLDGTITVTQAATYTWVGCYSRKAGDGNPILDTGAAIADVRVNVRKYSGNLEVQNLGQVGDDDMSIDGWGRLSVNANCTGGNITVRGTFDLNNSGASTITQEARYGLSRILSDSTAFPGASITEVRMAELGSTNLPADVDTLKSRQVVYEEGAVWVDNVYGSSGTTPDVNGTSKNPSSSMADAVVIAAAKNISRYKVAPGSNLVMPSDRTFEFFDAWGAYVDLNGKVLADCVIQGARSILGIATGIGKIYDSTLESTSFSSGWRFVRCALNGTVTITSTGENYFDSCFGLIGAKLDAGAAVGPSSIEFTHAAGEITVLNLKAGDSFVYGGTGRVILDSTCTAGTVWLRGNVTLVNNGSGMTINQDSRYSIDRILSDKIAFQGADIPAILTKLPNIPTKNTALDNFPFLMVLASDGVTPATGLVVTAERSLDGLAFAPCSNAVFELSNGVYAIDLAASDLNADTVMLRFSEATASDRLIGIITQTA